MAESAPLTQPGSSIEIDQVSLAYKKNQPVLKDVNLSLGTGFFGLLGANGAGKSSLMRIICTLQKPSSGKVTVCGYDTVDECLEVRNCIGYLPQAFNAWRLHRVSEVVDTLARISGMKKDERKQKVEEVLESVGLTEVADRKVKKLSGGMVRRLGVAQALVHDPLVLVVDEPTVGLDPEERNRFRQLMTELGRERTILLSTHIVADLGTGCAQVALLDNHQIAFQGSPADLIQQSAGYVYQVAGNSEQDLDMEAEFEIVSREGRGDSATFHVVVDSPDTVPSNASPVEHPSLEEAYLAFMAKQGKLEAASQVEEEVPEGKKKKKARKRLGSRS